MNFTSYLATEWVPALGCTEPASIAFAAATASNQCSGKIKEIKLRVDPKIYKNCYAVGIPQSGHKMGILWAVSIGANLNDPSRELESFSLITPDVISRAGVLIDNKNISIDVDTSKNELFIDCTVVKDGGTGRAVISSDHTNIILIEKDGECVSFSSEGGVSAKTKMREEVAALELDDMIALAKSISEQDMMRLEDGIKQNRKIAEHGLSLFPKKFVDMASGDILTKISSRVCAGVYARMWGEGFLVMSLAGSGNKGIVVAVPISMRAEAFSLDKIKMYQALALACLITSATTHYLGSLAAVCGCSNAAGIGLAAGLVLLEGGGGKEVSLAINSMVGNVTGMICDGAKIGCALKTMTSVDAAFRSASLALSGVGIPPTDGIVGSSGKESLANLGRIAEQGMRYTDKEILDIMQEKLGRKS